MEIKNLNLCKLISFSASCMVIKYLLYIIHLYKAKIMFWHSDITKDKYGIVFSKDFAPISQKKL